MSRGPPLLENPRLGLGVVMVVGLAAAALTLGGLAAWQAVGLYVVTLSLCAAMLFAWDKRRAEASKRRVSEANLWTVLLLGGALGAWIAMTRLRHKTRHTAFKVLVPLAASVHVGLLVWLAVRGAAG